MNASRAVGIGTAVALIASTACTDTPTDAPPSDQTLVPQASRTESAPNSRGATVLRADLDELNESGADGQVTVVMKDGGLMVTLQARGVSPDLPHAQHIHIGGTNTCPTAAMAGEDGMISTIDGAPAYGGVRVSLTTEGDVSAGSALAVPRFPVANGAGVMTYQRRFELPEEVTPMEVEMGVVVVHGISELFGDPAAYDGEPRSSLDPTLPLEATVPTLCGKLTSPET